jgi:hypothetical protein
MNSMQLMLYIGLHMNNTRIGQIVNGENIFFRTIKLSQTKLENLYVVLI